MEFTDEMRLSDTNADLVLDWRATYNGDVLEDTDFETPGGTAPGPVFRLSNLLPGDEGSLTVRLTVAPRNDDGSASPVEVYAWLDLFETAENGRNEPERKSGDATETVGELQDALDVSAWYDTGVGDVDLVGACNGRREPGEEVIVDGTLASAAAALDEPVRLDPHDGSSDGCFEPTTSVCVSYSWSLDSDVGNRIQSDSVGFAVGFEARSCDRAYRGGDDGDV